MKRSYTRYNTLNEDARRQQLRSNLRNSNRIVEDEEEDLDDIEIEADAVDSEVDGADEDFKQKLIDLFNQAVDAGILTIEDLTGEAEGDEGDEGDEGEDEETSEDDFGEDDLEESRKASIRARKVNEAKRRIMARRSVSNPRFVESARRRIARPASNRR